MYIRFHGRRRLRRHTVDAGSRTGYTIALAVLALLLPHILSAQSPRSVVVEEFTNASCDPCVPQNANFQRRFLDALPERVIPIVFHTRFPGRDAINAANGAMHNGRAAYYGVTGVPLVYVNGRLPKQSVNGGFNGAPADIPAILRAVEPHRSTLSPITITVQDERDGANAQARVTVRSTDALHDARLRVLLAERHRRYPDAGENGEQEFFFVARAMLPDSGTPLSLEGGATQTFTLPYRIDSLWSAREMFVVAFVQRDDTREILQAGTARGLISFTTGERPGKRQSGEEKLRWNGMLAVDRDGMYAVSLRIDESAGWNVRLAIDSAQTLPGAVVALRAGVPVSLGLEVQALAGTHGRLAVEVELAGERGAHFKRRFFAYAGDIDVLLIERDEGDVFIADAYHEGLKLAGRRFAMVERGDEDLFDWNRHLIVYEVGRNWIDSGGIAELRGFFERGGRMMIAGAEIAFALADPMNIGTGYGVHDPLFLERHLHARYARDGTPSSAAYGRAGDPVGNGIVYPLTTGVQNQDTPDELLPRDGAEAVLVYDYDLSRIAGIRYADSVNRLVYLGFGLEGNRDADRTAMLLRRSLDWLLADDLTAVPEKDGEGIDPAAFLPGLPSPLPASTIFHLPFRVSESERVRIDLYDLRGSHVRTLSDEWHSPGEHSVAGRCEDLPTGIYTIALRVGKRAYTRLLIVAR